MASGKTDELVEQILSAAVDLSDERIARLVDDDRAEAESEVKALLKSAIKAGLLQRALEHLGAAPPGSPAAEVALPQDEPNPALTAGACYVYCITAAGHSPPRDVRTIDDGGAFHAVGSEHLQAIVSFVSPDDFGHAAMADHIKDPRWLEQKVRVHDQVLKAALESGPIVPMRFCTVLRDEQAVRLVLDEHQDRLRELLDKLEGTREWGVKIVWHPGAGDTESPPPASGRGYLLNRQARLRAAITQRTQEVAADCHEQLAGVARESTLLPMQHPPRDGGGDVVLNAAYLVADSVQRRFRDLAAGLSKQHRSEGLTCEVTGPWPPYNFAKLDLTLQRAH